MTLWQLAESWEHWTIAGMHVPECHRCQLKKMLREKAKEWDTKQDGLHTRPGAQLARACIYDLIDTLGVPEDL